MRTEVIYLHAKMELSTREIGAMFENLHDNLIRDGALRDIYVDDTSPEQWRRFLHWLRAGHYRTEYFHGEEPRDLPLDPEALFQPAEQRHLIRIDIGEMWLHRHCFCVDEIELDFDPADVDSVGQLHRLLAFLAQLANIMEEDVAVTQENSKQASFLHVLAE